MLKHEKKVYWAILASEASHIFCCVIPTVFSILSLLSGFGLIATIPGWIDTLHHVMHDWEFPLLMLSVVVVTLGWGFHYYSVKNDCHDTGCEHKPCGPRKRAASRILIAATILMFINLSVYFGLHRGQDAKMHDAHAEHVINPEELEHDGHDDHDH